MTIKMKKTECAAPFTSRNSTRNATKTKVDNRWSMIEALVVRVDFKISTKKRSSPISTIRSPSVIENTPPDIMRIENIWIAQGSSPPPNIPRSPRL
jgi:hypothetical protein